MNETWKTISGIVVAIGAFFLVIYLWDEYDKNKADQLDAKLENVCGVIKHQQPNNISLYDQCMNAGYDEFAPSVE